MPIPTASGFGVDTGLGRTTSNSVEVANRETEEGNVDLQTTYGGITTTTEEDYSGAAFVNEALNGQSAADGVVVRHDLTEVNNDYARTTKETQVPLAAGA
jgi:hypothetical protein